MDSTVRTTTAFLVLPVEDQNGHPALLFVLTLWLTAGLASLLRREDEPLPTVEADC